MINSNRSTNNLKSSASRNSVTRMSYVFREPEAVSVIKIMSPTRPVINILSSNKLSFKNKNLIKSQKKLEHLQKYEDIKFMKSILEKLNKNIKPKNGRKHTKRELIVEKRVSSINRKSLLSFTRREPQLWNQGSNYRAISNRNSRWSISNRLRKSISQTRPQTTRTKTRNTDTGWSVLRLTSAGTSTNRNKLAWTKTSRESIA